MSWTLLLFYIQYGFKCGLSSEPAIQIVNYQQQICMSTNWSMFVFYVTRWLQTLNVCGIKCWLNKTERQQSVDRKQDMLTLAIIQQFLFHFRKEQNEGRKLNERKKVQSGKTRENRTESGDESTPVNEALCHIVPPRWLQWWIKARSQNIINFRKGADTISLKTV